MRNKNILIILGMILVVAVFAFAYKTYSVNIQKAKELEIIHAQQQKEQDNLKQKQDAKSEQQSAIKICTVTAQKQLADKYVLLDKLTREKFPYWLDSDHCLAEPLQSQSNCLKIIKDAYSERNAELDAAEAKCKEQYN